jgi:hypothetical protein
MTGLDGAQAVEGDRSRAFGSLGLGIELAGEATEVRVPSLLQISGH